MSFRSCVLTCVLFFVAVSCGSQADETGVPSTLPKFDVYDQFEALVGSDAYRTSSSIVITGPDVDEESELVVSVNGSAMHYEWGTGVEWLSDGARFDVRSGPDEPWRPGEPPFEWDDLAPFGNHDDVVWYLPDSEDPADVLEFGTEDMAGFEATRYRVTFGDADAPVVADIWLAAPRPGEEQYVNSDAFVVKASAIMTFPEEPDARVERTWEVLETGSAVVLTTG